MEDFIFDFRHECSFLFGHSVNVVSYCSSFVVRKRSIFLFCAFLSWGRSWGQALINPRPSPRPPLSNSHWLSQVSSRIHFTNAVSLLTLTLRSMSDRKLVFLCVSQSRSSLPQLAGSLNSSSRSSSHVLFFSPTDGFFSPQRTRIAAFMPYCFISRTFFFP